jgi:PqqD family protein of HPr-rel-A system
LSADSIHPGTLSARLEDYLWWEWAEEGVVAIFDQGSGETHLLDAASAEVLQALCLAPAEPEQLAHRLMAAGVLDCADDWTVWLAQILDGLVRLDLVVRSEAAWALSASR